MHDRSEFMEIFDQLTEEEQQRVLAILREMEKENDC